MFGIIYDSVSGKRRINPDQTGVVRRIFEEFADGASLIGITNALNEEFVSTMHGKTWSPATVFQWVFVQW